MRRHHAVSAAATLLVAAACTGEHPSAPTPLTTPPRSENPAPTAISLVSGNAQNGKAGEQLAEPFVVRVTDQSGNGVSNQAVSFEITSGGGALGGRCDVTTSVQIRSSQTDADGVATMAFMPTVLGRSTVSARLSGPAAPVTFSADATVLVVEFWFGYWNFGFVGPCTNSGDVVVPVGTPVEWRIPVHDDRYPVTYTVTSASAPAGASGFDSGVLNSDERFRFVPLVAGRWEYRDRITGLMGSLTAQ